MREVSLFRIFGEIFCPKGRKSATAAEYECVRWHGGARNKRITKALHFVIQLAGYMLHTSEDVVKVVFFQESPRRPLASAGFLHSQADLQQCKIELAVLGVSTHEFDADFVTELVGLSGTISLYAVIFWIMTKEITFDACKLHHTF